MMSKGKQNPQITLTEWHAAQTFRFGTISWAACRQFEDVYFPQVCTNRLGTSSLRVGFTITAAWL
jgi:hypothetical protein